jgi:regulatory protein
MRRLRPRPPNRWARSTAELRRVSGAGPRKRCCGEAAGCAEQERAFALALRELARRERTVEQLRRLLARRGIGSGCAERAVARLIALGMLDDARYARLFAEDKRVLAGWGSERIAAALAERGIDRELIAQALRAGAVGGEGLPEEAAAEEAAAEEAERKLELERARALLRRRFPQPLASARDRERALGVLVRKGFELELARDALAGYAGAVPGIAPPSARY